MFLTPILLIPPAAALLCLLAPWRRLMEWINILAFAATLALGVQLFHEVLAAHRGDGMERVFLRRCVERMDGAAHLGGVPGHVALRRTLFSPRPRRRGGDDGPRQGVLRAHPGVCHGHVPGGAGEQPGRDVVRAGGHRPVVRAAGGAVQPQDLARSRVEIHHARQPGTGAGIVRDGDHLRGGDWTGRRRAACRVSTGRI